MSGAGYYEQDLAEIRRYKECIARLTAERDEEKRCRVDAIHQLHGMAADLVAVRAALGKIILGGGLETRHDAFGTHHYLSVQPHDFQEAHQTLARLGTGEALAAVREAQKTVANFIRVHSGKVFYTQDAENALVRLRAVFGE